MKRGGHWTNLPLGALKKPEQLIYTTRHSICTISDKHPYDSIKKNLVKILFYAEGK